MTLLIACLVIYGLDMNPWLYAVAGAIWTAQTILLWVVVYALAEDSKAATSAVCGRTAGS